MLLWLSLVIAHLALPSKVYSQLSVRPTTIANIQIEKPIHWFTADVAANLAKLVCAWRYDAFDNGTITVRQFCNGTRVYDPKRSSWQNDFCSLYVTLLNVQFSQLISKAFSNNGNATSITWTGYMIWTDLRSGFWQTVEQHDVIAAPESYTSCLYRIFALFSFPLDVSVSILNAIVIRRILVKEDVQVFIYHVAVLVCNGIIYYYNLFLAIPVVQLPVITICYLPSSTVGPRGNGWVPFFFLPYLVRCFGQTGIQLSFTLSSCLQAWLAFDRIVALRKPIFYRNRVNRKFVLSIVLATIGVFLLMFAARVTCWLLGMLKYYDGKVFSPTFTLLSNIDYVLSEINACFLGLSMFVQCVCAVDIFLSVRRRLKQQAALQKCKVAAQGSLTPSYLIAGTCVLNLVAAVPNFAIFKQQYGEPQDAYGTLISLCCAGGFYVHCACCTKYKQCVAELLRVEKLRTKLRQVFRTFGHRVGSRKNTTGGESTD